MGVGGRGGEGAYWGRAELRGVSLGHTGVEVLGGHSS